MTSFLMKVMRRYSSYKRRVSPCCFSLVNKTYSWFSAPQLIVFRSKKPFFLHRDAFPVPSQCNISSLAMHYPSPREASFSPLSSHHLCLASVIIYASCLPSYKPVKRAVAGSFELFLPRLSQSSLTGIGREGILMGEERSERERLTG